MPAPMMHAPMTLALYGTRIEESCPMMHAPMTLALSATLALLATGLVQAATL